MEILKENTKTYKVRYVVENKTYLYCELKNNTYKNIDKKNILSLFWDDLEDVEIPFAEKSKYELEYLGYLESEIPNNISMATVTMVSTKYRSVNLKSLRSGKEMWFKIPKGLSVPSKGDTILIKSMYKKTGYKGRKDTYIKEYEKI